MYFSLITAADGREREAVHQRLDGPYADHQWLWRWFPAAAGTARDFLFRRHEDAGPPRYYIVSARPPAALDNAWQVQTRDYAPALQQGDRLRFELRANPSVRHGRDGKSKRHDVLMEAKKKLLAERGLSQWKDLQKAERPNVQEMLHQTCGQWLAKRGERGGFEIDPDSLHCDAYTQHQVRADRSLCFSSVDLSGMLEVSDPTAFSATLLKGLGSAKAMGCGLMLVKREP